MTDTQDKLLAGVIVVSSVLAFVLLPLVGLGTLIWQTTHEPCRERIHRLAPGDWASCSAHQELRVDGDTVTCLCPE
jgi:hypothetical protein